MPASARHRVVSRLTTRPPRVVPRTTAHPLSPSELGEAEAAIANSFLSGLDDTETAALLDEVILVSAHAGTVLYRATDVLSQVAILMDGLARTFVSSTDGRQLTLLYGRPGAAVAISSLGGERQPPLGVQALTDVKVLEFPAATLRRLAIGNPTVALGISLELQRLILDGVEALAILTFGSIRELLAWHLLTLSTLGDERAMTVAMTQQDLASTVGSVREVVARALKSLREAGAISVAGGEITVVDRTALTEIAHGWRRAIDTG